MKSPGGCDEPRPARAPASEADPKPEPGFGELLLANLRVVGWACVLGFAAYALWRGLRRLFPEVGWLQ